MACFRRLRFCSDALGFYGVGSFASNGYGEASPEGYSMLSTLVIEIFMTAFSRSSSWAPRAKKALAGVALFADRPALTQLWLFQVASVVGGAVGALIWKAMASEI
ncbi:aquaporin Z [Ruegeria lacuscaerulensis ITI-1157]|nr:aquaporin Z [Ruegeria lacuscaerulensis ITI-1157]SHJ12209.1 hypothetical protein SAMN05444404_1472 [Ruegeria lacuscaerulensis ITI-1157]